MNSLIDYHKAWAVFLLFVEVCSIAQIYQPYLRTFQKKNLHDSIFLNVKKVLIGVSKINIG